MPRTVDRAGLVLGVLGAVAVASAQPAAPEPAPAPASASTPAPAAAPAAGQRAALAQLLARTDAVAREVSKLRGLRLLRPIPNEVVDRDELRRRLLAMAAEDKTKAQTAAEGLALARWGMIPLSTDYEALVIELLTEQIAGYYDPDTKKLTISQSAGDDPAWAELVLAHEIQHGLQDQAFDLQKFEQLPDHEADAAAARRALVEGDGIALMLEVLLSRGGMPVPWSNPQVTEAIQKSMLEQSGGERIDHAPLAIREAMLFPYRAGLSFVAALRRRQPWSAVDAAFARPPKSTEQILHPERYVADDAPIPVAFGAVASLRGYAVAHDTVWGELGFQLFLRSHGIDEATAAEAAAGWGGDRAIVLVREADRRANKAVGLARIEWDTEADAIEAEEAAVKAIDASTPGAVVEHGPTSTKWLALDGTAAWVERRGSSLVIAIGAPAWTAAALSSELWSASRVGPAAPAKPAKAPSRRAQPSK